MNLTALERRILFTAVTGLIVDPKPGVGLYKLDVVRGLHEKLHDSLINDEVAKEWIRDARPQGKLIIDLEC